MINKVSSLASLSQIVTNKINVLYFLRGFFNLLIRCYLVKINHIGDSSVAHKEEKISAHI